MRKIALVSLLVIQSCLATQGLAQGLPPVIGLLTVSVKGISQNKPIPKKFAYCVPDGHGNTVNGGNRNPSISWSGAPSATRSYAIIVVDKDVPASFEDANKPGKVIPVKAPRQNFYHWVLVDIPSTINGLLAGRDSKGITPGGKPYGKTPYGIDGQNDYLKSSPGPNGGYDGPCPPWNDERLHNYHFIVYALDVPSLNLPSPVKGQQAEAAMAGHILAKGEVVGVFSNNPRWNKKLAMDNKRARNKNVPKPAPK